jgi:tRNA(Ile)-lysidine synthase
VAALSRTARHVAVAQELLDRTAGPKLARLRDGAALSLPRLRALDAANRIHVVRYWLRESGAQPPSTARLTEALRQLLEADDDHLPAVIWGDCALRRYRDRVFLTEAEPPRLQGTRCWEVAPGSRVDLGPGLGTLRFAVVQRGGFATHRLPQILSVRARSGGETLKPAALAKTQSVQHLCQSLGVLPWLRDALPFVYADAVLIAVADLWQDANWSAGPFEPGLVIEWERAPTLV